MDMDIDIDTSTSPGQQGALVFEPSLLVSSPTFVSQDPSGFCSTGMVPPKTIDFIGIVIGVDLPQPLMMSTSTAHKNYLDNLSLKTLASETYPDRATSRFIADAIKGNDSTCLWLNAKFSIMGHTLPKGLSIHLFANATDQKISPDKVRSMIIQSSEPSPKICECLEVLFTLVSFANLRHLMFYGIQLSDKFSKLIGRLYLEVFHVGKISYDPASTNLQFFRHCNTFKKLCLVHPDNDQTVVPPNFTFEWLVIYCPESSEGVMNGTKSCSSGLKIDAGACCHFQQV
jgi:hypothetical protein